MFRVARHENTSIKKYIIYNVYKSDDFTLFNQPNQPLIAETCNMFRQKTDIIDSWDSVIHMIDYFGNDSDHFGHVAGPGAWNDPDQVTWRSLSE